VKAIILAAGRTTIWRVRNNYLDKGLEYALTERDRSGQPIKYTPKKKVEIIAVSFISLQEFYWRL